VGRGLKGDNGVRVVVIKRKNRGKFYAEKKDGGKMKIN